MASSRRPSGHGLDFAARPGLETLTDPADVGSEQTVVEHEGGPAPGAQGDDWGARTVAEPAPESRHIVSHAPAPGPPPAGDDELTSVPTSVSARVLGSHHSRTNPGRLLVTSGNDRGREFRLTAQRTVIGRGTTSDIILTDIAVSREHIVVILEDGRYLVQDQGSGNGTYLKEVRVQGQAYLQDGDVVELGNTLLQFVAAPESSVTYDRQEETRSARPVAVPEAATVKNGPAATAAHSASLPLTAPPVVQTPATGPQKRPDSAVSRAPTADVVPAPLSVPSGAVVSQPTGVPGGGLAAGAVAAVAGPASASYRIQPDRRTLRVAAMVGGAVLVLIVAIAIATSGPGAPEEPEAPEEQAAMVAGGGGGEGEGGGEGGGEAELAVQAVEPAPVMEFDVEPPPPVNEDEDDEDDEAGSEAEDDAVRTGRQRPRRRPVARRAPPRERAPRRATPATGTSGAMQLYRAGRFDEAAAVAKKAARTAFGSDARLVEAMAEDFAVVATQTAKGTQLAKGDPIAAMGALQAALRADKRSGQGAQQKRVRDLLSDVAPRAAMAHMSAGRYERAKATADVAASYGAGTSATIKKVRGMLERQAETMYDRGVRVKDADARQAKMLWRRVLKMVPPRSEWYARSYKALSGR